MAMLETSTSHETSTNEGTYPGTVAQAGIFHDVERIDRAAVDEVFDGGDHSGFSAHVASWDPLR